MNERSESDRDDVDDDTPAFRKPYETLYREAAGRKFIDAASEERMFGNAARGFLDPLFSTICWSGTKLKDGSPKGYDDHLGYRYARWQHRGHAQLRADLAGLQISQAELREGVAQYIERPEIHSNIWIGTARTLSRTRSGLLLWKLRARIWLVFPERLRRRQVFGGSPLLLSGDCFGRGRNGSLGSSSCTSLTRRYRPVSTCSSCWV